MGTFVWYSKGSKETGELIAGLINAEGHGTVPPKNFSGIIVSFGAKPSEKFKWENRNIRALMNDPRHVRKFLDRSKLFDTITELGIDTVGHTNLGEGAQYANICQEMAIDEGAGFIACKKGGAAPRVVRTQEQLDEALADGCSLAVETTFGSQSRIRIFVVNGAVVGALRKTTNVPNAELAEHLAAEVEGAAAPGVLEQLINKGLIKAGKSFWRPHALNSQAKRNAAVTIAKQLGFGFCAIDMSEGAGNPVVYNVVSTPALVGHNTVHGPIRDAIQAWTEANDKSARELIQGMLDNANDEECEAILEGFREIKRQVQAG